MNDIESRLRSDAAKIPAQAPAELVRRIQDSLQRQQRPVQARRRSSPGFAPHTLGAAAAVVAAVAGILWLARVGDTPGEVEVTASPQVLAAYQDTVSRLSQAVDQRMTEEAELELELKRLSSDVDRIQARVRDELKPLL